MASIAETLLRLRMWEFQHLPGKGSIVMRDIIIFILAMDAKGKVVSVKDIALNLPYSDVRIFQVLKMLAQSDLMRVDVDPFDKRVRNIRPTVKLREKMEAYLRTAEALPPDPEK